MLFVFMAVDFQKENALEGAGMLVGYSMGIMSFPSCFLAVFAYAGLSYILDKSELLNFFNFSAVSFYIQIIAYWLSFFIVGYLQWFKVVPLLIEKSKSRSVQVR
jgi:hypothetical protein